MTGSGKGEESPTDFNECVSKDELKKLVDDEDRDAYRLRCNRQGMGGNQNRGNNDSFAKTKFTMIPFAGTADPEAYLDWEIAVEQKFNSHLVPAEHRVR